MQKCNWEIQSAPRCKWSHHQSIIPKLVLEQKCSAKSHAKCMYQMLWKYHSCWVYKCMLLLRHWFKIFQKWHNYERTYIVCCDWSVLWALTDRRLPESADGVILPVLIWNGNIFFTISSSSGLRLLDILPKSTIAFLFLVKVKLYNRFETWKQKQA